MPARAALCRHLLNKGFGPALIRPAAPRLNRTVGRSYGIDAEESDRLVDGVVLADTNGLNDKLRQWQDFCNHDRPHGGLGWNTPYENRLAVTRA